MKKHLQAQLHSINGYRTTIGTALMVGAGSAMAAVPTAVSTSLGALEQDVTTIAGLAFAAFLVIVAFAYFKRSAK